MPQPILVLGSRDAPNRFAGYLREILATEGVAAWDFHDMAADEADLAARDLVILENAPADGRWRARLEEYVRGGGRLIASRPPSDWAPLFGLARFRSHIQAAADLYVTFNEAHDLSRNLGAECIQFRGRMDLYRAAGATPLAWLAGRLGARTEFLAVAWHEIGRGLAAAFAYDPALCTVLLHQGARMHASDGADPDPNADGAFKPDDLFYRHLDERLKTVPQADLHADLLVRLIARMLPAPLPRLWHFPGAAPSVALLDGDSDSMSAADLERVVETVERHGGKYTIYLMPEHYETISPGRMAALRAGGHDAGPHPFAGRMPSPVQSAEAIRAATEAFRAPYGFQPLAHRGHNVVWTGWVQHARDLLQSGLRLDADFCCGAGLQYGYLNGSGLPVRFMDEDGRMLYLYEQATVSMEDGWFTEKCFLPAMSMDECIALSRRQIDEAADRWHAVYRPCFHPYYARPGARDSTPWIAAVAEHLARRGIPFVNGAEWVAFNDARRAVRFSEVRWDAARGDLSLGIRADRAICGLTVLLPAVFRDRRATVAPSLRPVRLEHTEYLAGVFDLGAGGETAVRVSYGSNVSGGSEEYDG